SRHVIFVEPATRRSIERAAREIEVSLRAVGSGDGSIADAVALDLAEAPHLVFAQVVGMLAAGDRARVGMALAACAHRFHAAGITDLRRTAAVGECSLTARLVDGRSVLVRRASLAGLRDEARRALALARAA